MTIERRSPFKASVPMTLMTPEEWNEARSRSGTIPRRRLAPPPIEPIASLPLEPCRREGCQRPGVHAPGSCDDAPEKKQARSTPAAGRRARTQADYVAPYKILRYESSPRGRVAVVECFCAGKEPGCKHCYGLGELQLWQWHQKSAAMKK